MGEYEGGTPRDDGIIRYGDHIALKHVATNRFLSSKPEGYSSGSYQQKIFTVESFDHESTWLVLPPVETEEEPGYEVGWDDPVRLVHVSTRVHLHSHPVQSPVSGQQEVSGFGNDGETDDNDNWEVKQFDEDDEQYDDFWRVGQPFRFCHKETRKLLHSHGMLLEEDCNEVTADNDTEENAMWVVSFD